MVNRYYQFARGITLALALTTVLHCGSENETKSAGGSQYGHLFNPPAGQMTPNRIYGTWAVQSKIADGKLEARVRFERDKITVVNRCIFDDGAPSLTVGLEARAVIDDVAIRVLESKDDEIRKNNHHCSVSMKAGTYPYRINGTQLTDSSNAFQSATKLSD